MVLQVRAAALGVLLASAPAHAGAEDPFDAGTISAQSGVGLLSGALGCGAIGLAGAGIGHLINSRDIANALVGGVFGCIAGTAVGLVIGIDAAGDSQGANGTAFGTSLGLLGGTATLVAFEVIADRTRGRLPTEVHVLVGIVTLVGGPVIGYHLTADQDGARKLTVPVIGFSF